ncbi:thioredoxin family protein [Pseudomonas sp. NPDC087803]|uniref:thioredoxin family protein n=1 Tax=Pseudomonas sp. NPDC087803 TaxID=3364448 RepID=UPI00382884D7
MGTPVDVCNDLDFESVVLQKSRPTFVMFCATWSGPSKEMAMKFKQAARSCSADVGFVMLDVDESPQMAQRFEVTNVPTTCVFKNGTVVATLANNAQLTAFIDRNI